jgi:hypothetical protein
LNPPPAVPRPAFWPSLPIPGQVASMRSQASASLRTIVRTHPLFSRVSRFIHSTPFPSLPFSRPPPPPPPAPLPPELTARALSPAGPLSDSIRPSGDLTKAPEARFDGGAFIVHIVYDIGSYAAVVYDIGSYVGQVVEAPQVGVGDKAHGAEAPWGGGGGGLVSAQTRRKTFRRAKRTHALGWNQVCESDNDSVPKPFHDVGGCR